MSQQVTELSDAKRRLLNQYLRGERRQMSAERSMSSRTSASPASISPSQERMWRHAKSHPELTCYNEPITIHRKGPLDMELLKKSFEALVQRHECWRTTFHATSDRAVQVVARNLSFDLPYDDLRQFNESRRLPRALALASQDGSSPFDLERGPLFRARVVRLAAEDYRIFITAHHLILDGVTVFDILYSNLVAIYESLASRRKLELPDLGVQYSDFAEWQRQHITSEMVEQETKYWRTHLHGVPNRLQWPTEPSHPMSSVNHGSIHSFTFPQNLSEDLRAFSRKHGVTLFVTLLTGFVVLLHRYTAQSNITVGTVTPGARKRPEVERLMGLFQNRLPLRVDIGDDPQLFTILNKVRDSFMDALSHDEVPFDVTASELRPETDEPSAFYQAMFSLEPSLPDVGPGWDFTTMDFDPGGTRLDLYIEMDDRPTEMLGRAQYDRQIFNASTMARLVRDFENTLETFIEQPEINLSSLGALPLKTTDAGCPERPSGVCPVAHDSGTMTHSVNPSTSNSCEFISKAAPKPKDTGIPHCRANVSRAVDRRDSHEVRDADEATRISSTCNSDTLEHPMTNVLPLIDTPSTRSKRIPALSLFHLLDPEVLANPYPLFRRLRTEDPVHWDPYLHAWVVTRYQDVLTVLLHFSADRTPTPEQLAAMGLEEFGPIAQLMVKQMLFMDAPAHTRLRSLASYAFGPDRVAVLRKHIQGICDHLLDAVVDAGRMDVIADLGAPLPAIVTAEMLGVPVEDHEQLKQWSTDFAEMLGNFQHNPDHVPKVLRTVEDMTAYFHKAVCELRKRPRPGLVHSLMTAQVDGDRLTDEEVVANSIVTMVGGQETTTNLIGNGILTLLRNPSELQRLRSNLSIIPSAVEELLRYEPPSQHTGRLAPADVELGGKLIRKRQAVIAVMAAGNRDPDRFPDPDRLDLTREDNRHLSFGWAAHFCFGAALARIEGKIVFETMLRRFPEIALEPGTPLQWRTNLGLRGLVALPITFRAT